MSSMPTVHVSDGSAFVRIEPIAQDVIQIRLDRPERLNALGMQIAEELHRAVTAVLSNGKLRVLLIRGTGRSFCAGADLKERREMPVERRIEHNRAINEALQALIDAAIPTIAVVNGLALGGGCEVALACDLRVMSADASIGLTEAQIGVIPGAGATQRLPRLVGAPLALEMMFSGNPISAERAAEIGLVNHVVPAAELDRYAAELAVVIASRSPLGLRKIKRLVRNGMEMPLSEGLLAEQAALAQVVASRDYSEGLAAFSERRSPAFNGT